MRHLSFDRMMKKRMAKGAALGMLAAVVFGAGSVVGAEPFAGPGSEGIAVSDTVGNSAVQPVSQDAGLSENWVADENGIYHYYGEDGQMWVNTVTPDGKYVDGTGAWIPAQYEVSRFTTIPADAKSLLVIEGHGSDARASFYVKEVKSSGQSGPGASETLQTQWKKLTDTGGHVGEYGIGKEREGDRKTPRGIYTLDEAFGTKPDPGNFKVPYLQVDDGHYWVGDSTSPYYNMMVNIRDTGAVFDTAASEHLSTIGGPGYYYCMSVGYNKERTPYKGSAIFLHCMYGPYTAGCIAIPEEAMVTLLENLEQPAYILMDDAENLKNY